MNKLAKVLLGIAGVAIIGKIGYDIGHLTCEMEHQINEAMETLKTAKEDIEKKETSEDQDTTTESEEPKTDDEEPTDKPEEKTTKKPFSDILDKIKTVKAMVKMKKDLKNEGGGGSVIGRLIRNPEGAKIEVSVVDDEVQVSIKPKAA